jgi:hypothetical protein
MAIIEVIRWETSLAPRKSVRVAANLYDGEGGACARPIANQAKSRWRRNLRRGRQDAIRPRRE